jgi:deazaflavin-dependent oxidoreductase (nitroreductase family)
MFASKGGAPNMPDWFYNLVANPETSIEVGTDTVEVHVSVAVGDERDTIWGQQKAGFEQFAEYEAKTDREILVVVLDPR